MTQAELLARAAIAKTLAACTQAGDARKAEEYARCFTADGVLELTEHYTGRDAIRRWMTAPSVIPAPAGGRPGFVSHHLTTCRIAFTAANTANVRTYWMVISAVGLDHSGYYEDRFVDADGEWLIAHRRPRTLWISAGSLIAPRTPR
jgi:SnoaL-like domain